MKLIFLSHATANDSLVPQLRRALEAHSLRVWADSRELTAGAPLDPEIRQAIDQATHVIVILSWAAFNSAWVQKEVEYARSQNKPIIPVMLPGIEPPALLEALGESLPIDKPHATKPEAAPVADLVLELTDPQIITLEAGPRRARAKARVVYNGGTSPRYEFLSPLGQIDADELAWYLERYINWPSGVFQIRAAEVEKQIPAWGQKLYQAVDHPAARTPLEAWKAVTAAERRFTVRVEKDGGDDEAATLLLALPWELIRDDRGYLFQGAHGVRVRRSLPNANPQVAIATDPPLRVLLVSPRPEEQGVGYIDHRVSARPLVEALNQLGDLAEFTLLQPPTFAAMEGELRRARRANQPYHIVHFDGHGVYDHKHGLGALCFEDPADSHKTEPRRAEIVTADKIAEVIRGHRVPLFFLDACQSAKTETAPASSVAGKLLESGVASVAAMSHSVLVETARRFVSEFYPALIQGERVGEAMLAGQRALKMDTRRGRTFAGELRLEDWFVPVLFQEQADPQLIHATPDGRVRESIADRQQAAVRGLPPTPGHGFVGRSRELLTAERLLARAAYVVLLGEGKTTLAVELARWLVATRRFERAAFVALDQDGDARKMLYKIGDQLMPDFPARAGVNDPWQLVERALREQRTVLVVDNVESVLDDAGEVMALCTKLAGLAKLVFTSREALPEPFTASATRVGRLDRVDAIRLVGLVRGEGAAEDKESEADIEALVDAVGCHARALALLAREVAAAGVRAATADVAELMRRMEARHPGERERSLLASVELSLRRLPPGMRERIRPLGAFQAGGSLTSIALALKLDKDAVIALGRAIVGVGLAEEAAFGYLRFDPALAPALGIEMSQAEREAARTAWAEAMAELIGFLYQLRDRDANVALNLTRLELANLVAAVEWLNERTEPERVVGLATRLEALVAHLGRPKALAQVAKIRADAAGRLGAWSHANFAVEDAAMDRWIDAGQHQRAVAAGRVLLEKALAAGEDAYVGAAFDIAMVQFTLGRALQMAGGAAEALGVLEDACTRFERLGQERMANVALGEKADCLLFLGRLEQAAKAYEEAIRAAEHQDDTRQVAVGKGQLATVRSEQKRFAEALKLHGEVKDIFVRLGEPGMVAVAWHQMAIVHQDAGQLEAAEHAYQESLKLKVAAGNTSGEAATLLQLGNLYSEMNRLEDAVRFYREASDRRVKLEDKAKEGVARSNAADKLIRLKRYAEARQEVNRAIECKKDFGHASEPWKTFMILHDLERAEGRIPEALAARQRAMEAYLAYRRDGGESTTPAAELFAMVAQQPDAARELLTALRQEADLPQQVTALIPALEAVLNGSRDPSLAANPDIDFDDVAELLLLIAHLAAAAHAADSG